MRVSFVPCALLGVFLLAVGGCGGSFGRVDLGAGFNRTSGGGFDNIVFSAAPADDGSGKVYFGGGFATYNGTGTNRIARLKADGTLDKDFSIGTGFDGNVYSIAPVGDGSGDVYVGGAFATYDGTAASRIVRLKGNGTLDTSFDIGTGFDGGPGFLGIVTSIATANDGSGDVYVGGDFITYNGTSVNRIVRLSANGTVDSGFAIGTGFNSLVLSVAIANDGSGDVYVGGSFATFDGTGMNGIVRLNANGTLDTGFAIGTGFNSLVFSIAPAKDGSGHIYVGGSFTTYNSAGTNCIVRLNADGTVDSGFAIGTGFDNTVQNVAPAIDGTADVYVGGFFTSYNGTGASRIVRLKATGARDGGFALGSGFSFDVFNIAAANDGSSDVFVVGDFSAYNGTGAGRVVRLDSDGTVD
jgi:hypothetical protein